MFGAQIGCFAVFSVAIDEGMVCAAIVQGGVKFLADGSAVMPVGKLAGASDSEVSPDGRAQGCEADQPEAFLHKNDLGWIGNDGGWKLHDDCVGQITGATEFGWLDGGYVRLFGRGTNVDLRAFSRFPLEIAGDGVETVVLPAGSFWVHEIKDLGSLGGHPLEIAFIHHQGKADLALIAHTAGLASFFLGAGQRGEEHGGEHSNDRDHHEKFNERECSIVV